MDRKDILPPGWDTKYDVRTGRWYFINHYTKTTTFEDPRMTSHKPHPGSGPSSIGEYIPLQHGSPDLRRNYVYPSQPSPIPAFQIPGQCQKYMPLQDMKNTMRASPLMVRSAKIQDTTFTTFDVEESVAKISAMFPTASETHIRILLKNRYMKSIFPQAEETMILDVLSSNDNNIQKSSDKLKEMGFVRKDTVKLNKLALEAKVAEELAKKEQEAISAASPPPIKKLITLVEKAIMLKNIKEKYGDIPDRVISLALESVEYDEIRANKILQIMVQDDNTKPKDNIDSKNSDVVSDMNHIQIPNAVSTSQSRQSLKSLLKTKDKNRVSRAFVEENNAMNNGDYKAGYQSKIVGANANLVNGPNEKLLLEDYVKWQGPNRRLVQGSRPSLAIGPNKDLLITRAYKPCGSNPSLCMGRQFGLAKGSLFAQMNAMSLLGECRGK